MHFFVVFFTEYNFYIILLFINYHFRFILFLLRLLNGVDIHVYVAVRVSVANKQIKLHSNNAR